MSYFCTKCQRNHKSGKIFEEHKKHARIEKPEPPKVPAVVVSSPGRIIPAPKKMETEWAPMLKSKKMSRYNGSGDYVERYMTPKEELEFARSIAIENGKKWTWFDERKRKKKLKKLENTTGSN